MEERAWTTRGKYQAGYRMYYWKALSAESDLMINSEIQQNWPLPTRD